jgi:hypothetical protein
VDDFERQKIPFGERVERIDDIRWVCNLFAVPTDGLSCTRWQTTLNDARRTLQARVK